MAWGELVGAGVGLLGGLFGKKGGGNMDALYAKLLQLYDEGMRLYRDTDLNLVDQQLLDAYDSRLQDDVQTMLDNHDTALATQGLQVSGKDSERTLSRTGTAFRAAKAKRDLQAQLVSTRANRKAALLPKAGDFQVGAGMAGAMDARDAAASGGLVSGLAGLADAYDRYRRRSGPEDPWKNVGNWDGGGLD